MSALEIGLLIVGAIIFVISFIVPVSQTENTEDVYELVRDEVKKQVADELQAIRSHVDDVVDEAVEYAQEKTERSLERLTNEKIMAVNEYSETVLEEIRKNQQEVLFLYDMLNDKHENLKNAVTEAAMVTKATQESTREAEAAADTIRALTPLDEITVPEFVVPEISIPSVQVPTYSESDEQESPAVRKLGWAAAAVEAAGNEPVRETSFSGFNLSEVPVVSVLPDAEVSATESVSQNEAILALYELGKSEVDIARELNIGVGEVSLIIGLYAGKDR